MITEIKRNNWSRFCRKFSTENQYRKTTVSVKEHGEEERLVVQGVPLVGITITKRGRYIDGVEFFAGAGDPDRMMDSTSHISRAVRMILEKDENGNDCRLEVQGKDGKTATVNLCSDKDPHQYRLLVERTAYLLSERHGFTPGRDVEDWLEAERKIKDVELRCIG